MRDGRGAGGLLHLRQGRVMIPVLVGGDDRGQRPAADQGEQRVGLVSRIDQRQLARLGAAQQVGIVVHRADCDLGDGEAGR